MKVVKSKAYTLLSKYIFLAKPKDRGFTLIELLVVIIIIGILVAIALPSFLNQSSKARQSEGKTYISTIVRAQQAYLIEKKRFACGGEVLFLGLPESTNNYEYAIDCGAGSGLFRVTNQAIPLSGTKAYLGGISISTNADALLTLCEALLPIVSGGASGNETFEPLGFSTNAPPVCPIQYVKI